MAPPLSLLAYEVGSNGFFRNGDLIDAGGNKRQGLSQLKLIFRPIIDLLGIIFDCFGVFVLKGNPINSAFLDSTSIDTAFLDGITTNTDDNTNDVYL